MGQAQLDQGKSGVSNSDAPKTDAPRSGIGIYISPQALLCCLGFTLLTATDWCMGEFGASITGQSANGLDLGRWFSSIPWIATMLIWAAAHRTIEQKLASISKTTPARLIIVVAAFGVCSLAGRLLAQFGGLLGVGPVPSYLGNLLWSVAEASLLLLWLAAITQQARYAPIIIPVAFALVALLYFALAWVPSIPVTVILACLPLVSAALYAIYLRGLAGVDADANADTDANVDTDSISAADATDANAAIVSSGQTTWGFPVYPVTLMFVYSFVFYFSLALSVGPSPYGSVGMVLIALVALIGVAAAQERDASGMLYLLALPLMVAGLLILGYLQVGREFAAMFTNASRIAFDMFILTTLCATCHRFGISALWMFGIVEAFSRLAGLLGMPLGRAFTAAFPVGSDVSQIVVAVVIVVLIALSMLAYGDDHLSGNTYGMLPVRRRRSVGDGAQGDQDAQGSQGQTSSAALSSPELVMTYYERVVWECGKVARRYGLTQREQEILELLVQGLPIADIAEKTVISRGTAKTHINHIYKKLDVHSREEAKVLVEQVAARR